jgi:hypothetical protein
MSLSPPDRDVDPVDVDRSVAVGLWPELLVVQPESISCQSAPFHLFAVSDRLDLEPHVAREIPALELVILAVLDPLRVLAEADLLRRFPSQW